LYSQSGNAGISHNSIGFIRVSNALVDDLLGTVLPPALDHKIKIFTLLWSLTNLLQRSAAFSVDSAGKEPSFTLQILMVWTWRGGRTCVRPPRRWVEKMYWPKCNWCWILLLLGRKAGSRRQIEVGNYMPFPTVLIFPSSQMNENKAVTTLHARRSQHSVQQRRPSQPIRLCGVSAKKQHRIKEADTYNDPTAQLEGATKQLPDWGAEAAPWQPTSQKVCRPWAIYRQIV